MKTAKLFTNGRSQAVRLPRDCRFKGKDVYVHRLEGAVMLMAMDDPWAPLVASLERFSDDFMSDRAQPPQQRRGARR